MRHSVRPEAMAAGTRGLILLVLLASHAAARPVETHKQRGCPSVFNAAGAADLRKLGRGLLQDGLSPPPAPPPPLLTVSASVSADASTGSSQSPSSEQGSQGDSSKGDSSGSGLSWILGIVFGAVGALLIVSIVAAVTLWLKPRVRIRPYAHDPQALKQTPSPQHHTLKPIVPPESSAHPPPQPMLSELLPPPQYPQLSSRGLPLPGYPQAPVVYGYPSEPQQEPLFVRSTRKRDAAMRAVHFPSDLSTAAALTGPGTAAAPDIAATHDGYHYSRGADGSDHLILVQRRSDAGSGSTITTSAGSNSSSSGPVTIRAAASATLAMPPPTTSSLSPSSTRSSLLSPSSARRGLTSPPAAVVVPPVVVESDGDGDAMRGSKSMMSQLMMTRTPGMVVPEIQPAGLEDAGDMSEGEERRDSNVLQGTDMDTAAATAAAGETRSSKGPVYVSRLGDVYEDDSSNSGSSDGEGGERERRER